MPELLVDGVAEVETLRVHGSKATEWARELDIVTGLGEHMPGVCHLREEVAGRVSGVPHVAMVGDDNENGLRPCGARSEQK